MVMYLLIGLIVLAVEFITTAIYRLITKEPIQWVSDTDGLIKNRAIEIIVVLVLTLLIWPLDIGYRIYLLMKGLF